ncbi:MarR family winged helix-turn-helix transcriptional regulator [Vallicoccus soli]|nr:MarR family winged helix-turn-helix transcriptional regulator [Vallicoccus soli]
MSSTEQGAAGPAGTDVPSPRIADVEQQLVSFVRLLRRVNAETAREMHPDLEPSVYGLLVRISDTGGSRVTDLATYYGVGKPTVSRQVAMLERVGLVARTTDPEDARASVIALTPDGARRLAAVRAARHERLTTLLAPWSEEDLEAFARLLGRFNDLMR